MALEVILKACDEHTETCDLLWVVVGRVERGYHTRRNKIMTFFTTEMGAYIFSSYPDPRSPTGECRTSGGKCTWEIVATKYSPKQSVQPHSVHQILIEIAGKVTQSTAPAVAVP